MFINYHFVNKVIITIYYPLSYDNNSIDHLYVDWLGVCFFSFPLLFGFALENAFMLSIFVTCSFSILVYVLVEVSEQFPFLHNLLVSIKIRAMQLFLFHLGSRFVRPAMTLSI